MASPIRPTPRIRTPERIIRPKRTDFRLQGKNAVVTGAGSGIGREIAVELAFQGVNVFAISRSLHELQSLGQEHQNIRTFHLNVNDWVEARHTIRKLERMDFLINNAGISVVKELDEISEDEVDRTFATNVKAIINVTQIIAKQMKLERKGVIVNISCVIGYRGASHSSVYCASKGAVDQLTRCMAIEYGPYGIRVNSVNPTVTNTTMAKEASMFEENNEIANALKARHPLRRFAETKDVVGPVLFLLSDQAEMVTGITLPVDGGLSACFL